MAAAGADNKFLDHVSDFDEERRNFFVLLEAKGLDNRRIAYCSASIEDETRLLLKNKSLDPNLNSWEYRLARLYQMIGALSSIREELEEPSNWSP